jgi:hypothetical protein
MTVDRFLGGFEDPARQREVVLRGEIHAVMNASGFGARRDFGTDPAQNRPGMDRSRLALLLPVVVPLPTMQHVRMVRIEGPANRPDQGAVADAVEHIVAPWFLCKKNITRR